MLKRIKKLDASNFTKELYKDDREILKRHTLFSLWKDGYIVGYAEGKKVPYKPNMFMNEKIVVMLTLNENGYLRDRFRMKKDENQLFWFHFSKEEFEITQKMIENYIAKKKEQRSVSKK